MSNKKTIDYNTKVLEVNNLKQHFVSGRGKRKITVKAVDDISFDVYKREVFGIVGESGCGKTTTGRSIIKLYEPTSGEIIFNGYPINIGFEEELTQINNIKKQLKLDLIHADPYKKAIYEAKESSKITIKQLNQSLKQIELAKEKEIRELSKPFEDHKDLVSEQKNELKTKIQIANNNYSRTKKELKQNREKSLEKDLRKLIKVLTAKTKNNKKIVKYQENISLEEKQELYTNLDNQLVEDIKLSEDRVNRSIDFARSNRLSKDDVLKKLDEAASLRTQLIQEASNNYQQIVSESEKQLGTKEDLNIAINKIKADTNEIEAIKIQISAEREKLQKTLLEIKKDKTNNVEKYAVDKELLNNIKLTRNTEIAQIKEAIKLAKKKHNGQYEDGTSQKELLSKIQMIFQDPISSINPRMIVKEIIAEGLKIQGEKDPKVIEEKVYDALNLVGLLPEHATRYPHEFSGGQRQRIGIARALVINPELIIADEPISALDVSIQAQVINLLNGLKDKLDLTIVFIAHDLSVVKFFSDRIAVMYYGKIVELTTSEKLFKHPLHPYTISLLSAIPQPDPASEKNRKRIVYDPRSHDYQPDDEIVFHEVEEGHWVRGSLREMEMYKQKIKDLDKKLAKESKTNANESNQKSKTTKAATSKK